MTTISKRVAWAAPPAGPLIGGAMTVVTDVLSLFDFSAKKG